MPNLVGIGLSQVPTNSMLGGMAYQDPEHASIKELDLKNLSQINSEIADTTTAVFVYDTSKDSDGGAWRKRTQNTSWYNETLGTEYRGTRKEFPAVAVIVGFQWGIKIYDGDDPDLSLWAFYTYLSWDMHVNSIVARDGKICFSIRTNSYSGNGFGILDYVKDRQSRNYVGGYQNYKNGLVNDLIASKRKSVSYLQIGSNTREFTLVNYHLNDVAMTVLPNAPIDSATGLPVPTIAVATAGGVSVIKDDGNVYNLTYNSGSVEGYLVEFDGAKGIFWSGYSPFGNGRSIYLYWNKNLPSANDSSAPDARYASNANAAFDLGTKSGNFGYNSLSISDIIAAGASNGLFLIDQKEDSPTNGMTLQQTSSFNTGWQHGDIKGAFLSDTDVTDGTDEIELSTNGSFSADSNWTKGDQWTISGGSASITDSPNRTNDSLLTQTISGLQAGKSYAVTLTWSTSTGDFDLTLGGVATRIYSITSIHGASGTKTFIITAASSDTNFGIVANQHLVGSFSSISLKLTNDISGSEKIANYNFAADFSTQWEVKNSANTSYDATNDRVTVTSTQNYSGIRLKGASLPILTQGKRYIMTVDIHSITNSIRFGIVSGGNKDSVNSTGAHTLMFTAGASISEVYIEKPSGSNSTFVLNSVSIREAEEDRSVNDKGLQVFGTVTKSAVATGADLVAYSGFSASNYLQQSANSDFAFGTGDFSVILWYKSASSGSVGNREVLAHTDTWLVIKEFTNYFRFGTLSATTVVSADNLYHVAVVRSSGIASIYVNGSLEASASDTTNITNSDGLMIGQDPDNAGWNVRGSISLVRLSTSTPSAEQVKKMYEDEKCLFHENAKATLYGSSDAVTALAYDDTTNLLHVGTSAGRSEFQGLRRINNTTTAVTTAISASNGFVAEQ